MIKELYSQLRTVEEQILQLAKLSKFELLFAGVSGVVIQRDKAVCYVGFDEVVQLFECERVVKAVCSNQSHEINEDICLCLVDDGRIFRIELPAARVTKLQQGDKRFVDVGIRDEEEAFGIDEFGGAWVVSATMEPTSWDFDKIHGFP